MNSQSEKVKGAEKIFNMVLPTIYPMITKVEIERTPELFRMGNSDYTVSIYTDLPNTITDKDYWENEYWFKDGGSDGILLDYHYMNDVIIPQLLKYVGMTDREFSRDVELYNVDGGHILSTR